MLRTSFAHTRTSAGARRPQPSMIPGLAPVSVLAEGLTFALDRLCTPAFRWAGQAAMRRDRMVILRAVLDRRRVEQAWFPGDPL